MKGGGGGGEWELQIYWEMRGEGGMSEIDVKEGRKEGERRSESESVKEWGSKMERNKGKGGEGLKEL